MRNNRQHIYLMPGLGANSLIFEYLDFPKEKYSIHLLDWIMPIKNESIENYCSRFSKLIIHDDIILIGVSFGGVLVQEMSKIIPVTLFFINSYYYVIYFYAFFMKRTNFFHFYNS